MFLELASAGKFPLLSDILLFTYNFGGIFFTSIQKWNLIKKGVNTIQKDTITYLPDALKCELKVALRERNSCARC